MDQTGDRVMTLPMCRIAAVPVFVPLSAATEVATRSEPLAGRLVVRLPNQIARVEPDQEAVDLAAARSGPDPREIEAVRGQRMPVSVLAPVVCVVSSLELDVGVGAVQPEERRNSRSARSAPTAELL
jgi:hypothetical protein